MKTQIFQPLQLQVIYPKALKHVGAEIVQYVALPPPASCSLSDQLGRLKSSQCRVFVVHLSIPAAVQLIEKAKRMKKKEKDYVWITTDPPTTLSIPSMPQPSPQCKELLESKVTSQKMRSHFNLSSACL
ncbi:hypothetical protein ACFX12_007829 [Malus domestica]